MLTAAVRDLHLCYPGQFKTDVRTSCPELWENNPYITPISENDAKVEQIDCSYPLINHANERPYHCLHGFIEFLNEHLKLAIKPTRFKGDNPPFATGEVMALPGPGDHRPGHSFLDRGVGRQIRFDDQMVEAGAIVSTLSVDMWPDVSELRPEERCATPLTLPDGHRAELYSAYNPATVQRHFQWMEEYGLPGVFLQRFTGSLGNPANLGFRDAVARNVQAAAESHGRVFAIMYDTSGHPPESLVEDVERDWKYLVDTLRVTESPRYLHHRGRPVLAIWGFGFSDRPSALEQAVELIDFFKNNPDPRYRVTLMGGVPARWRTLTRDAQRDQKWASVYRSFDIVSPWTVGRFKDARGIDRFYGTEVAADLVETRRLGIDYLPVVFPGFSWHNLKGAAPVNAIPRRGGRFYWRQVARALRAGNTMIYAAMFDEVDESTAMFKIAPSRREAPGDPPLVTLDADGEALPSDWYLRLARETQNRLTRSRVR